MVQKLNYFVLNVQMKAKMTNQANKN